MRASGKDSDASDDDGKTCLFCHDRATPSTDKPNQQDIENLNVCFLLSVDVSAR